MMQHEQIAAKLEANNMLGNISSAALLECLGPALTVLARADNAPVSPGATFTARRQFTLGLESDIPLDSPDNRVLWRHDMRTAFYHNESSGARATAGAGAANNDRLKAWLRQAKNNVGTLRAADTPVFLATEIGKKICSLLLKSEDELDISTTLLGMGMDSLVAIELRNVSYAPMVSRLIS